MAETIFLTGGAGYIGTCTAATLSRAGYEPILLDNFSTSPRGKRPFACHEIDLCDTTATRETWKRLPKPAAVIHFAARALVPESCENPEIYFRNNFGSALNVVALALESGCPVLHSSSCAVYGVPEKVPIPETAARAPVSPYGETKVMVENLLHQFRIWKGLRSLNLRYFNPAGAVQWKGSWLGETHEPETHLVPRMVASIRAGQKVAIFGKDYPTPDGTCVRDFIHIEDLAEAHLSALQFLFKTPEDSLPPAINVGGGTGTSVLQASMTAKRALGCEVEVEVQPRRPGDPPILVADTALATHRLGWKPKRTLDEMIVSHSQYLDSVS